MVGRVVEVVVTGRAVVVWVWEVLTTVVVAVAEGLRTVVEVAG